MQRTIRWSPTGKPVAPAPTPRVGRTSRPPVRAGTANGAHGQGRGPTAGSIPVLIAFILAFMAVEIHRHELVEPAHHDHACRLCQLHDTASSEAQPTATVSAIAFVVVAHLIASPQRVLRPTLTSWFVPRAPPLIG